MPIKITAGTAPPKKTDKRIRYKDLHLDLEVEQSGGKQFYSKASPVDMKVSVDEAAIINSIRNIFTTTPGERILEPTFGLNLAQWLFQPLDEFTAQEIGETIVRGIRQYEPRVEVKNLNIDVIEEQNQYTIQLTMSIPMLNIDSKTYDAILSTPGFDFITDTPVY